VIPLPEKQQPPEASLGLEHEGDEVHQTAVIAHRDEPQLIALPVVLPPRVELRPGLERGSSRRVTVEVPHSSSRTANSWESSTTTILVGDTPSGSVY
jgi:hypothetical protein